MPTISKKPPNGSATTAAPATRLGIILAGGAPDVVRPHEIRGIGKVGLRLLRRLEMEDVDLAVAKWRAETMKALGLGADEVSAVGLPITKRDCHETLARALRDPDAPERPFGTFEEIGQLDDEILGELWVLYEDLRAELDPAARPITEADAAIVRDALAKKNSTLLVALGAQRLSAYLLTTADPPAS